jgi:hypothetical protein
MKIKNHNFVKPTIQSSVLKGGITRSSLSSRCQPPALQFPSALVGLKATPLCITVKGGFPAGLVPSVGVSALLPVIQGKCFGAFSQ